MKLLNSLRYKFTTVPTTKNFPYVFGGVQENSGKLGMMGNQLISTLFGNNLKEGFEMAYRGILESIVDKDI